MRAWPYGTAPDESGADSGSDRYVGKRWEYSASAGTGLRMRGGPDVGLNLHDTYVGPLLEVTGKARHDDIGNNQSVKINKFRHADTNRRALVQVELRPQTAERHHELAAKVASSERRLRRKGCAEEDADFR